MGLFGGSDLPEQWVFEDVVVQLDARECASISRITVRHTVDRRRDMTLGALGLALRSIEAALGAPQVRSDTGRCSERGNHGAAELVNAVSTGEEGFLITVHGVHIGVPHDMQPGVVVDVVSSHVAAMVAVLSSLPGPGWHRYDEEHFKHFFRCVAHGLGTNVRTLHHHPLCRVPRRFAPESRVAPRVWLEVLDVEISLYDDPMESWFERAVPLWLDEAGEREAREHVLRRSVMRADAALRRPGHGWVGVNDRQLTSPPLVATLDMRCSRLSALDKSSHTLNDEQKARVMHGLLQTNSERYIARMRALPQSFGPEPRSARPAALMTMAIERVGVDVVLAASPTLQDSGLRFVESVDAASRLAFRRPQPCLPSVMVKCELACVVSSVTVRLRRFRYPIAQLGSVVVQGTTVVAQHPTRCDHSGTTSAARLNSKRLVRHVTVLGTCVPVSLPLSPPKVCILASCMQHSVSSRALLHHHP